MIDLHSQLLHCFPEKPEVIGSAESSSTATPLDSICQEKVSPTVNSDEPDENVTVADAKRPTEIKN
jgi:hypothetical protein